MGCSLHLGRRRRNPVLVFCQLVRKLSSRSKRFQAEDSRVHSVALTWHLQAQHARMASVPSFPRRCALDGLACTLRLHITDKGGWLHSARRAMQQLTAAAGPPSSREPPSPSPATSAMQMCLCLLHLLATATPSTLTVAQQRKRACRPCLCSLACCQHHSSQQSLVRTFQGQSTFHRLSSSRHQRWWDECSCFLLASWHHSLAAQHSPA